MHDTFTIDAPFAVRFTHRLRCTRRCLDPANPTLADALGPADSSHPADRPARVLAFVDSGVAVAWPRTRDDLAAYARAYPRRMTLAGDTVIVPGGETIKNDPARVEGMIERIRDARLCRQSYVLAIGGGAVLDAAGYAAAVAHRGIRLIRVPTTTLAQGDSGVGVKNGINAFGRKNYQGVFAPPWAVINDEAYLATLDPRDRRCGLSEAVKVGLVKDAAFFERIERDADRLAAGDEAVLIPIIRRSAELHLRHITDGGDPFEMIAARPLDFGHWSAHRLEQLSGYDIRHGEAVAIGIAIDTLYSARLGLLHMSEAERILRGLRTLGFTLSHPLLSDPKPILAGLEEFREHLGGRLTIMLLKAVGHGVDVHEVDASKMAEAIAMTSAAPGDRPPRSRTSARPAQQSRTSS